MNANTLQDCMIQIKPARVGENWKQRRMRMQGRRSFGETNSRMSSCNSNGSETGDCSFFKWRRVSEENILKAYAVHCDLLWFPCEKIRASWNSADTIRLWKTEKHTKRFYCTQSLVWQGFLLGVGGVTESLQPIFLPLCTPGIWCPLNI